ncbi:MAG: SpoIIE family protein phosphatase [Desulfitobacteriia bacterium]|jgi:hypothetical protein
MKDKRLYIEDLVLQASKRGQSTCGDYYLCQRTSEYSIFILCDGIGSGIKANIAAIMCANRLLSLLESGISLYRACEMVISMMHKARTEDDVPFAAFSLAWILNNGQYTIISYESPVPLLVKSTGSEPIAQRHFTLAHELVSESKGVLKTGETLILMTDGLTQAGMGRLPGLGWGTEGINSFINFSLYRGKDLAEIAQKSFENAALLSGNEHIDDTTLVVLNCRQAKVFNLMTGPATERSDDENFVREFMNTDGEKAICGSTTADVVARVLNRPVEILSLSSSFSQPPKYKIKGIDLVTEGAVTLNQVFNILDEDPESYDKDSCVSELCEMMRAADIIRIFIGGARNPSHQDISFKQMGVLPRHTIVDLLIKKLTEMGKIVLSYPW